MSMTTRACEGAAQSYKNLITPSPIIEGALARCGGVSLAMVVAGVATGYSYMDPNQSAAAVCSLGSFIGAIKGTNGGIRIYPGQTPVDSVCNNVISAVIFLSAGGIIASQMLGLASRSPVHSGAFALVATHIGAIAAGALKGLIER